MPEMHALHSVAPPSHRRRWVRLVCILHSVEKSLQI